MGNKHKHEADRRVREESLNSLLQDYYHTKDRQDLNTAVSLVNEELVNESHNIYREFSHHNKPSYKQQELYEHARNFLFKYLPKESKKRIVLDDLIKQIKHEMRIKNSSLVSDS